MVKLVGILNITPDSFSDGGKFFDPAGAIAQAERLFANGASLVDIGAESTRPGAMKLTVQEEWQRLEQVLKILLPKFPGKISLDSYHPETIENAFKIGPVIVNDVTGMNNPAMREVAVKLDAQVIISHLPGLDVQTAHESSEPAGDIEIVKQDLIEKANMLIAAGLLKENIILDPGIGFGKTMELNKKLLEFAEYVPDFPVMIGYSRKRFLGEQRMELTPNLEAGRTAIRHGAAYLRVHDVAGHTSLLDNAG